MELLFIIIGVIIFAKLFNTNKNLKIENENLKRGNEKLKESNGAHLSFCPKCGTDLRNYVIPTNIQVKKYNNQLNVPVTNQPLPTKDKKVKEQLVSLTKEEQKNNLILITGAILIVLSVIIFLGTTWVSTGNITKTVVILFMLVVFYFLSKISDKVFHLHQTSQAFFYIALCYVPISLLSISLFGLFGHYLSIYGSGKFLYFSISSLIVTLLYYIEYKQRPTLFLRILLELFAYITIIFISFFFQISTPLYYVISFTYIIIREYIATKKKEISNQDKVLFSIFNVKIVQNLLTITELLAVINIGEYHEYTTIYYPTISLLALLSFYILIVKIYKKPDIYNYIYPILIILTFTFFAEISLFNFNNIIKEIIVLFSFIPLMAYSIHKEKSITLSTFIPITIASVILYTISQTVNAIMPSVILVIYLGITLLNYLITPLKKPFSYLLITLIILLSISLKIDVELSNTLIILIPELILLISLFYKKLEKNIRQASYIVGTTALSLEFLYIAFFDITYINTLLVFLASIIFLIYYFKKDKEITKFIGYIALASSLSMFLELSVIEHSITYGVSLSTLLVIFLEIFYKKTTSENSYLFIILTTVLSLILLNSNLTLINFILIIAENAALLSYSKVTKKEDNIIYIPAISLIPSIFFSDLLLVNNLNGMVFLAIALISIGSYLSYLEKDINKYTVITYLYIILLILCYELNTYINMGIVLVCSYLHYLSNDKENKKDFFLFLVITSILIIIRKIFVDMDLMDITVLSVGSILVYYIIISRQIIKKHTSNYKILEYIVLSIINLAAIPAYNDELDGILYVTLLIGLLIIGYTSKLGPIFLVSIIFILLNALILTREFWLSLPWWIYVLLIGIILVLFAMRNEARNNKAKENIEKIKKDLNL